MTRPSWDFEYLPISRQNDESEAGVDFVVATWSEVPPNALGDALRSSGHEADVCALLVRPPLFWYRVRTASPWLPDDLANALGSIGLRYVTSSTRGNLALGPRPDFGNGPSCTAAGWRTPPEREPGDAELERHWFLDGEAGVDVDRSICGRGSGTRLAVIDDEARDTDLLGLDAEVMVGVTAPPRGSSHGAAMVAWAVGSRGSPHRRIRAFVGVAPDASPRLYVIPRAGQGVMWLPLAIVRAVDDGADVVVCATYVEDTTSPLLDDALEFAVRSGRSGLGTAVLLPTGREISSPPASVHASLTLSLADPASDPRVLSIAPSGRNGGWFFWTDKSGKRRPFANRGPSVGLAAPGDDMAYPFATDGRFGHAESSGAAAIAAGVALLVVAKNPGLGVDELYGLLTSTARACLTDPGGPMRDAADALPEGRDRDGHEPKCGYGRASAVRACIAASDPVAAALLTIGEEHAARRFSSLRERVPVLSGAYSARLANWAVRMLPGDALLFEEVRVLCRHFRLLAGHAERQEAQAPGAALRALALVIARLSAHPAPPAVRAELGELERRLRDATRSPEMRRALETALLSIGDDLWLPRRA